jgi:ISXO2-like transposase domain/Transposase zinc-ribbon domain
MNLIDVSTQLQTEDQCLDFIEKVRWPDGKIRCVRCGTDKVSRITRTVNPRVPRSEKKQNKRTRLYACLESTCKHRFTPTVGTLFHDSHLPLSKWFAAVALIVHAKKGMSAKQVQRHLGVNYRTAWYMGHRIRKAMASGEGFIGGGSGGSNSGPQVRKLSGTVEIDETYVGGKTIRKKERGTQKWQERKAAVVGMIERGGELRLRHVGTGNTTAAQVRPLLHELVDRNVDRVMTDESTIYPFAFDGFCASKHETIAHKYEYVRGDVYTNTIESAFSLFKRGVVGSFHRVSHKHLQRYLYEFEFRFNRRTAPDLFRETIANLVGTKPMEYRTLVA